jgi:hypothetical protein
MHPHYTPKDVARFWSRVDQSRGHEACWPFLIHAQQYNKKSKLVPAPLNTIVRFDKKNQLAHRVSYLLTYGPIPDGMVIRHRCANAWCVNPSHLLIGTQQQNINDMYARKRADVRHGELFTYEDEPGWVTFDFSEELHERIKRLAEKGNRSLNGQLISMLEAEAKRLEKKK